GLRFNEGMEARELFRRRAERRLRGGKGIANQNKKAALGEPVSRKACHGRPPTDKVRSRQCGGGNCPIIGGSTEAGNRNQSAARSTSSNSRSRRSASKTGGGSDCARRRASASPSPTRALPVPRKTGSPPRSAITPPPLPP